MSVIRSQCQNDDEYKTALRDDFAAKAMQGICANPSLDMNSKEEIASAVSEAYEIADALLAEREKAK